MNLRLPRFLRSLRHPRAWLALLSTVLATALAPVAAQAQEDPPGRVGRLAELQGAVKWYDHEQGRWADAERNRPLTSGDRLSTGAQGRAELRVGSTVLRVGAATELEVARLDDERMVFQLHSGNLALRVRSREVASDVEVKTAEVRFRPERSGHYRFDRLDDTTQAGVWRGTLRIDDREGFILETGQRVELWREKQGLRFKWNDLQGDSFADWVQRDDQRDEQRSAANRYVSPEMTGAEELDRAGRWEQHPEYGAVWYPLEVRADWAPYRYGRWIWVSPWGWTWVDEAPWGFAPFHYGRWVQWRGRWGWCPGDYVARPVYAPALVAWTAGPGVNLSIRIGGPPVSWVPLAPREWYTPAHRVTPVYVERVNPRPPNHRGEWRRPEPVGHGPVRHGEAPSPALPSPAAAVQVVPPRLEQPARVDRTVRPERPERPERSDRADRPSRQDRPDRRDRTMPVPAATQTAPPAASPQATPTAAPPAPAAAHTATPAPAAAPQPAAAPPARAQRPPREERPREEERKRGPENRGGKEERERREQQR